MGYRRKGDVQIKEMTRTKSGSPIISRNSRHPVKTGGLLKNKESDVKARRSCMKKMSAGKETSRFAISTGLCNECRNKISGIRGAESSKTVLDAIEGPVLLMQPDPRQVYTANKKASGLFGKKLQTWKAREAARFLIACTPSVNPARQGPELRRLQDKECGGRDLQVGKSADRISTHLQIRKHGAFSTYLFEESTERVGELALLIIDRHERV